ncbi:hypothetical protein ANCCAN_30380, partial [Ancylostoma caninum]
MFDTFLSLKETPEEERLGTHNRLMGVLTNVSEEIDVPLYYEHDQLFNVVKCSVPKAVSVKSAILNAGYKAGCSGIRLPLQSSRLENGCPYTFSVGYMSFG